MKGPQLCLIALLVCFTRSNSVFQLFGQQHIAISGKTSSDPNWSSLVNPLQQADLNAHNNYRAAHGVAPLTLSASLNSDAQAWAEHLQTQGTLTHATGTGQGENLALRSSSEAYSTYQPYADYFLQNMGIVLKELPLSTASDAWYNEIADYNFSTHTSTGVTGHFTQLVWTGSTHVGFGYSVAYVNSLFSNGASGYRLIVVARYSPQGNVNPPYDNTEVPPLI